MKVQHTMSPVELAAWVREMRTAPPEYRPLVDILGRRRDCRCGHLHRLNYQGYRSQRCYSCPCENVRAVKMEATR